MILDKQIRKDILLGRRVLHTIEAVIFAKDAIILAGERDFIKVEVPPTLIESLSLPSPIYVESGAPAVADLLTTEGEFQINQYKFRFVAGSTVTEMRTTVHPTCTVPGELLDSSVTPIFSCTLADLKTLAHNFKFLHQVSHLNTTASPYRDRFFLRARGNSVLFFATNGAIFNSFEAKIVTRSQGIELESILPSKILLSGTAGKKASEKIELKFYGNVTLVEFDRGNFAAAVPKIHTDHPNPDEVLALIDKCDNTVTLDSAADLQIPQEIANRIKVIRYVFETKRNIEISAVWQDFNMTQVSPKLCEEVITPARINLNYREFNLSLNSFLRRLIFRWSGTNPSLIIISDDDKISIHATELLKDGQ